MLLTTAHARWFARQVRIKNAYTKKMPEKDAIKVEDLDWIKTYVVGNQMKEEIYCTDWDQLHSLTQQLYKSLPREELPLRVIAPRHKNKADEHDMKQWCLARYQQGLTSKGWLELGREFSTVIAPPLEQFKETVLAMRGACCSRCRLMGMAHL